MSGLTPNAAVIYCRVSSAEQTLNFSLATQEKVCREFCERSELDVLKVFIEAGASAKTTARPEFQKMLAYCEEHKDQIGSVVVYNVSRFARSIKDHFNIRGKLHSLGISLQSVCEPFNDSSSGKLMEGFLALFAEHDNNQRAERTIEGMAAALGAGKWTTRAPLGYIAGARAR